MYVKLILHAGKTLRHRVLKKKEGNQTGMQAGKPTLTDSSESLSKVKPLQMAMVFLLAASLSNTEPHMGR